jgi:hypothetical protein
MNPNFRRNVLLLYIASSDYVGLTKVKDEEEEEEEEEEKEEEEQK